MLKDLIINKVLKAVLPVILTLVLLLTGCSADSKQLMARVGEPAPDFRLQNLNGQSVTLSELRGKPVLLNFWATWCPPCRAEMPYLQEIYEEWTGMGLVLLTINVGESSTRVKDFLETYNLSLPVLLDTNRSVANKYNITGIPTTFFIDKDGIIQEKVVGSFRNKEQIERYLDKIVP